MSKKNVKVVADVSANAKANGRTATYKMSKVTKQIMTCGKFINTESRNAFKNAMVDAEVYAKTVERVVYDKLVPNVSGYGLTLNVD